MELRVLMSNGTEEQENVEKKYYDQAQPDNEQASNHGYTESEDRKPTTLSELMTAQESDLPSTPATVTIGLQKSLFCFHTEGALVRLSALDGTSQRYILTTL